MKLKRDKVISIVKGRDLVGLYVKFEKDVISGNYIEDSEMVIPRGTELLLAEMSPTKADKIIKIWNSN